MNLFDVYPRQAIRIERAEGSYVWDENGQRYLDLYGGHAVISIGHAHPHYLARMNRQLQKIGFYSNSVLLSVQEELAARLGAVSGKKDYQLFLCNSGAEANENALKLASFHTGRKKIVAFSGAFHGRTSLAVAASDYPSNIAPVNEAAHVCILPFNDEAALENWFQKQGDETAAVITEGIQGVAGIRVANDSFLQAIRRHCDASGAVFIADGIQCGYGRTGLFFSHDHSGVQADLYTVAKGMGNGFPVAGVLIAPHIQARHGMLGTTFGGNPLACAAALAVLEVMQQEDLMQQAAQTGHWLMEKLQEFPALQHLRGRGLMIGFEAPEHTTLRSTLLHQHKIFTGEAKPRVIRLLPALNLKQADAALLLEALAIELQGLPEPKNTSVHTPQNFLSKA